MKKILLALVIVLLLVISSIYVLIPGNIAVSTRIYTHHKVASILRCIHDDTKWQQWFPGKTNSPQQLYYNNQQYIPRKKGYTSIDVSIINDQERYTSVINIIPIHSDSSAIQWQMQIQTGNNPFQKIARYKIAKKMKQDVTALLDSLKTFIQTNKNVYGFDIKHTTLTDTALVSIKTSVAQYPSTLMIYSMINQLKKYIAQQHATEHNYPMLNITQLKDSSYEVMVGIPTNIPLKGTDVIKPKRMIMLKNKTLVTEVTGDTSVIKRALSATTNYMHDNELSSPVIPFQQLVTDRSKEKDSTKWITKIFTPFS